MFRATSLLRSQYRDIITKALSDPATAASSIAKKDQLAAQSRVIPNGAMVSVARHQM